jgi:hypothetical protein
VMLTASASRRLALRLGMAPTYAGGRIGPTRRRHRRCEV